MNETDYINATDLAKVRIALKVIRDLTNPLVAGKWNDEHKAMMRTLLIWELRLRVMVEQNAAGAMQELAALEGV